ncbi:MAG: hypothetical protein OXI18_06170 [bacterium]|nr:hypothetical protein [bacterium]
MTTKTEEIVHTIDSWHSAREAYRSKALRQALFDGSVVMDDVLINLHGREHRDRRRIENPLFRRDVQLVYEREDFPEVVSTALAPHLEKGRCALLGFAHRVMLNLSCINAGVDRRLGNEVETERLLKLLAEFIEGAHIHHYQGDRAAKVAEIAPAVEAFDIEFVEPSLVRRQQLIAEGAELPRDVLSVLLEPIDLGDDPGSGGPINTTAVGELTIKDITRTVEIQLEAQLVDYTVVVVGSTEVVFADYDVTVPRVPIVLSAEDHGIVEIQLFFTRG